MRGVGGVLGGARHGSLHLPGAPRTPRELSVVRFASESFPYLVLIPLCRQNLSLRRERGEMCEEWVAR